MSRRLKKQSVETTSYQASEELYQALFEQSADGIFIADRHGRYVEVNQRGCEMLGYTRAEMLNLTLQDLVPAEDLARDPLRLDDLRAGIIMLKERRLRCKDGRLLPVEISARMLSDGSFLGMVRDINERKRAEEERQAHLRFFESLDQVNRAMQGTNDLEQMMSDVLDTLLSIFDCDRAWLVYPCDPEAARWQVPMERTRPEYPGTLPVGVELPLDPVGAEVFQILRDTNGPVVFGPGSQYQVPEEVTRMFSVQSFIVMAFYPKIGKPWSFGLHQCSYPRVWISEDQRLFQEIGRRLADALTSLLAYRHLQESEHRLEEAQRIAHAGHWDRDFDADTITLSDETYRIFGLSHQEGILDLARWHERWQGLIHPEDRLRTAQAATEALQGGPRYDVEYRVIRPNGEVRFVRSQGDVTWNEAGRPRRMFGTMQDITELKRAEQELQRSNDLLRAIIEAAPTAIIGLDLDGNVQVVWNPAAEKMLGWSAQEVMGRLLPSVPVESQEEFKRFREWIRSGKALDGVEVRRQKRDGSPIDYSIYASPLHDAEGRVIGNIAVLVDITERKRVEEELRKHREQLEELVAARTAELKAQNEQLQQEIVERQQAEQTLMTERNLLRTLIDNLPDQIYVKNRESQFMLINPAVMHDLGINIPDEAIGKTDFDFHPPELAAQYYADEQAILQSGRSLVNKEESNVDQETGVRTWVLATKVPLYNGQGKLVGLVGIGRDITERKQAEEALRQARAELEQRVEARTLELRQANKQLTEEIEERKRVEVALRQSEERYRNLVECAPDVVYTLSREGTFTSLNPAFERTTGWSQAEWQGRSYAPLLHPEDLPLALAVHDQVMQGKTSPVFELRVLTRQGDYIVGEFTTTPLWQEEAVVGVLGIARDITRRKRAEEGIQRRNRELALLNQVIAASVTETQPEAILEIVCRELALAFDVPQAAATLLNEQKTEASVVAEYLTPGRPSGLGDIIPVEGNPSYQYLLSHKMPLALDDAQNDPRLTTVHNLLQRRGTKSLLLIPFLIEGEVVGSLGLDAIELRSFSTEEVSLAWSVANQVSGVLARLRLDQERHRLEAQYYQAQKMEAIGRLTGGVAHDFNNILTVIIGYCGFILDDLGQSHPLRQDVEQVQKAAERATSLTRQLLAFSRQEILRPRVLKLNDIVTNIEKMLRRLIGEDIGLVTVLEPQLGQVKADPGQLEQIIMNLVINARDAMPQGGKLTIETANIHLDEEYTHQHVDVVAGPYIMLAVSDTGLGMDEETQARIFEPFFTTKELGQGTGLGLATVHGIVHQSGGHIWVYSELGHGTIFKIYLPQIEAPVEVTKPEPISVTSSRGTETILLVEDEAMVRELARRALISQGYNVLEAGDSVEAYKICLACEEPIHLLLTDVVIPGGLSGPQLAKKLMSLHPELKVLYMSGYTGNAIVHHRVLDSGIAFLQKPFVLADLIRKVREVLDTT